MFAETTLHLPTDPTDIWALAISTGGVIAFLWKAIPFLRRVGHIVDDIQGEAPRPGLPLGRPSMMDRLANVEDHTAKNALATGAIGAQLNVILEAVSPLQSNGGTSLRDAIDRIEKDTASAAGRPIPITTQVAPAGGHADR